MFDSGSPLFADVILPLPLGRNYTYRVPEEYVQDAVPGKRVVVQFGKKRYYSALIHHLHNKKPSAYAPKPITAVLDAAPIVLLVQLQHWEWIADYYLAPLGDVMNAALPAGFKLESETSVVMHPDFKEDFSELDDKEYLVAEALTIQKELPIKTIQEILGQKTVYHIIRSLLEKKVLVLKEELQKGYKPKTENFISLAEEYEDKGKRKQLFDELEKAPKQLEALMQFFQLKKQEKAVRKADLAKAAGKNYGALNALIKKGIFIEKSQEVSRIDINEATATKTFELSEAQQTALGHIKKGMEEKDVVLLHGVTGSGKTEIYSELIKEAIAEDKQILYLLPEISLTAQLVARLKRFFGDAVGIYHSRFSTNERVEIWQKVLNKEYKLVIGARSSLFLPFQELGLVIVDEEHDPSFKQYDPSPRYNARDAAIYLGGLHKAKILLGSATPSVESYFNATKGKYHLVELKERYGDVQMPKIKIVDVKQSARMKNFKSNLTDTLVQDLKTTLENKKQVILFRNRRGYAPMLTCGTCGYTPQCLNCDVTLTYHKFQNELKCHYCGYKRKIITTCPACAAHNMQLQGFGTEKIEDELKLILPEVKIARMDLDAVKSKYGHNRIIEDFEDGKVNVLVGTQMVTKGLDFENVSLVGVLNSDQLLYYPDFRSNERAFQLMVQVSGRSGRKNQQGEVIIQARDTHHPVLKYVINNDYDAFFTAELMQRKQFMYPPYVRLINLHLKHKDHQTVQLAAKFIFDHLRKQLGKRIYPPNAPVIGRIRNYYLMELLIKLERNSEVMHQAKAHIKKGFELLATHKDFKSVQVFADVDPY